MVNDTSTRARLTASEVLGLIIGGMCCSVFKARTMCKRQLLSTRELKPGFRYKLQRNTSRQLMHNQTTLFDRTFSSFYLSRDVRTVDELIRKIAEEAMVDKRITTAMSLSMPSQCTIRTFTSLLMSECNHKTFVTPSRMSCVYVFTVFRTLR